MPNLVFISALFLFVGAYSQNDTTPPRPGSCQPITSVTMCRYMDWKNTSFPNLREHATQEEAAIEMTVFVPFVRLHCSNAIVHFLCSIYTPYCTASSNGPLKPCREFCEYVRRDCEPLFETKKFKWPPHFECNQFPSNHSPLCLNIPHVDTVIIPTIPWLVPPPPPTSPSSSVNSWGPTTAASIPDNCTVRLPEFSLVCHGDTTINKSNYIFADIENCAVNCTGLYFNHVQSNVIAPTIVLVCALICIVSTLFTVATFIIDKQQYSYPKRPIIYLTLCYLAISLAYFIGSAVKLINPKAAYSCSDTEEDSYVFQHLPDAVLTSHSAICVVLFIVIYYSQMAASIWWVVLMLTYWLMISALKWGKEAVQRLWVLYHIASWCIPAIQVIPVLVLELVDGDQLSGVCYTGNHMGLGMFVFLPLTFYLILGIIFLVIGFGTSLVNTRLQNTNSNQFHCLQLQYSLLYVVPNLIYLCLCFYELTGKIQWEMDHVKSRLCEGSKCDPITSPSYIALLLRYVALFLIGIFSIFWIISSKTIVAWKKFFIRIFSCWKQYDLPNKNETVI